MYRKLSRVQIWATVYKIVECNCDLFSKGKVIWMTMEFWSNLFFLLKTGPSQKSTTQQRPPPSLFVPPLGKCTLLCSGFACCRIHRHHLTQGSSVNATIIHHIDIRCSYCLLSEGSEKIWFLYWFKICLGFQAKTLSSIRSEDSLSFKSLVLEMHLHPTVSRLFLVCLISFIFTDWQVVSYTTAPAASLRRVRLGQLSHGAAENCLRRKLTETQWQAWEFSADPRNSGIFISNLSFLRSV